MAESSKKEFRELFAYTLLILGVGASSTYFIYDERKINNYESQVKKAQETNSSYVARIDYLEFENNKLFQELKNFEEWNAKSADPSLYYRAELKRLGTQKNSNILDENIKQNPISYDQDLSDIYISRYSSYINDELDVVIGVSNVNVSGEASIVINDTTESNRLHNDVKVGMIFELNTLIGKKRLGAVEHS